MTNLILTIILVGAAVTYAIELITALLYNFFLDDSVIKKWLSLPLSLGGMWVMQRQWTVVLIVTVPAATFVSLFLIKYLNKPQQVDMRRVPRI